MSYRDGNWHAWTGGYQPVKDNDIVEVISKNGQVFLEKGCKVRWIVDIDDTDIVAFRVIEQTTSERERVVEKAVARSQSHVHLRGLEILYDEGFLKDPDDD